MEQFKRFFEIKNLCRTCLKEEVNLKNIHGVKITIKNNCNSVMELLNLLTTIEINENWPENICEICIEKVMQVYSLKLQCENSNKLFEEHLNLVKIQDSPESDTKRDSKEICCYNQDDNSTFSCIEQAPIVFDDSEQNDNTLENELLSSVTAEKNTLQTNSEKEKYCCIVCGNCFKTRKSLFSHKKIHGTNLQWLLCNKKFPSKVELRKHCKTHQDKNSGSDSEEITNLSCTKCRKTFNSKYSLVVHEKRHIYEGHFLCTFCGKGFNARGCLNRHMRVHTGEKKYECSVCHKKFPSSNNLNLHFRIHSGEKPYLCTVCGKSFSHPTGLTYHLRTHTKDGKYKCKFCSKAFSMQCHLDNHTKIHTGERPHACKQCNRAFIKKIDLQRHELTHSGVKPHVCTVCDKDFLRPLHLNYHMMTHTAERPHRCPYCGKGFIRRYYLKDHMMKHHGIEETK